MAKAKSTPIILIGIAVFVVGAALTFVFLHGHNKTTTKKNTASATTTTLGAGAVATPAAGGGAAAVPAFTIPAGKNAVAVSVAYVPGAAGFVRPGDGVNIYATVKNGKLPLPGLNPPEAKLILSNVEVLFASGAAPGAGTGSLVFVLALDPNQAEQVIFFTTYESLYFSLVPKNAPPAATSGRSYQNAF